MVIIMQIGEKIKQLRIKTDLTQEELANRAELSKGFISQVERDLTSPSITTLVDILECLGTNLKDFFNEDQNDKIVFEEEDVFIQENEELGYSINWIIPNAQKNRMEPILLKLKPKGCSELYSAHDGEVFGYILEGIVTLKIGNKKFSVKSGESFYYKANSSYCIENNHSKDAWILWVSTPPNF